MSTIENSVNLVGEDTSDEDSSTEASAGADKYIEIWKEGLLCDAFFEVGAEKRPFRAHRLILAFFSTVFRTCFFGSVVSEDGSTEQNPTLIPDVDPDAFELMLTFMYSGENINSIQITDEVVVHLLYAAEKYHIPLLKRACARQIDALESASAPCVLQQALHYNDLHIAERCCNIICDEPGAFLASEDFLKCGSCALEMIVGRDEFSIESEISLLERLLQWASAKCTGDGVEETRSGKRAALGSLLYLVRFPLMTIEELKEVVLLDIMTEEEAGQLFTMKVKPSTTYDNFITRKRLSGTPQPSLLLPRNEPEPTISDRPHTPPELVSEQVHAEIDRSSLWDDEEEFRILDGLVCTSSQRAYEEASRRSSNRREPAKRSLKGLWTRRLLQGSEGRRGSDDSRIRFQEP